MVDKISKKIVGKKRTILFLKIKEKSK